jgi:hypothetical protein
MQRQAIAAKIAKVLSWAAMQLQSSATQPEQREFLVVVTGAGDPTTERVNAISQTQAVELGCALVAARRLKNTSERSWRLKALVEEHSFEVVVQCVLKAEVAS